MAEILYFGILGVLLLWITAASITDYSTTKKALALGGRESIPGSNWLMAMFGTWHWIPNFVIRGAFVYAVVANTWGWQRLVILAFLAAGATYPIWHNRRTIKRLEQRREGE